MKYSPSSKFTSRANILYNYSFTKIKEKHKSINKYSSSFFHLAPFFVVIFVGFFVGFYEFVFLEAQDLLNLVLEFII